MNWDKAIISLVKGGIGVIPTDTLYGLVGSALLETAVERIYRIKGRDYSKPLIVLIRSIEDLVTFHAKFETSLDFLARNWPSKLSVILKVTGDEFEYIHRGTHSIAFRIPENVTLQELLFRTGPLVAPSANPQGEKPARTIEEALNYFGDRANFYIDGGVLDAEPSTVVDLSAGKLRIVREGSFKISEESQNN
jgi:L-threonylcarbamoyladenylate synthase